jgi:hypothetical protein
MTLLLPAALTLGTSLAAADPGPEARQRAARVRASLLSKDWAWVQKEPPEEAKVIRSGLTAWACSASDLETLVMRLQELCSLVFEMDGYFDTQEPLDEDLVRPFWSYRHGAPNERNLPRLPVWGADPENVGDLLLKFDDNPEIWTWDLERGLAITVPSLDRFGKIHLPYIPPRIESFDRLVIGDLEVEFSGRYERMKHFGQDLALVADEAPVRAAFLSSDLREVAKALIAYEKQGKERVRQTPRPPSTGKAGRNDLAELYSSLSWEREVTAILGLHMRLHP